MKLSLFFREIVSVYTNQKKVVVSRNFWANDQIIFFSLYHNLRVGNNWQHNQHNMENNQILRFELGFAKIWMAQFENSIFQVWTEFETAVVNCGSDRTQFDEIAIFPNWNSIFQVYQGHREVLLAYQFRWIWCRMVAILAENYLISEMKKKKEINIKSLNWQKN